MRQSTRVVGIALVVLLVGSSLTGAVQGLPVSQDATDQLEQDPISGDTDPEYDEDEYEDEREDENEEGPSVIGEWWGLGGEAQEAPYMGTVELGVVGLVVGVGGYSLAKRTSVVPLRHRKRLLQAHEWTMLAGVALVVPHLVAVEEWEGLGLLVALLLGLEVLSGLYGRHLHRHVLRLGRGEETPAVLGRFLTVTKRSVLSRWRTVHVLFTVLTALVLAVHIVTAIAD